MVAVKEWMYTVACGKPRELRVYITSRYYLDDEGDMISLDEEDDDRRKLNRNGCVDDNGREKDVFRMELCATEGCEWGCVC